MLMQEFYILHLFLMTAFPYTIKVHRQTSWKWHSWCFRDFPL